MHLRRSCGGVRTVSESGKRKPGGHDPWIAKRLRAAMMVAGVKNQAELAREMGLSRASVSNWFRSATAPDTRHREGIQRVLRVPLEFILWGTGTEGSPGLPIEDDLLALLKQHGPDVLARLASHPERVAELLDSIEEPDTFEPSDPPPRLPSKAHPRKS